MTIDTFHGFTLAILLLFVGKGLVARWGILRRYNVLESLMGSLTRAFGLAPRTGLMVGSH